MNKLIDIIFKISLIFSGISETILGLFIIFINTGLCLGITSISINISVFYLILIIIIIFGAAILCITLGILDILRAFNK